MTVVQKGRAGYLGEQWVERIKCRFPGLVLQLSYCLEVEPRNPPHPSVA